jgi:hypothetical protein
MLFPSSKEVSNLPPTQKVCQSPGLPRNLFSPSLGILLPKCLQSVQLHSKAQPVRMLPYLGMVKKMTYELLRPALGLCENTIDTLNGADVGADPKGEGKRAWHCIQGQMSGAEDA